MIIINNKTRLRTVHFGKLEPGTLFKTVGNLENNVYMALRKDECSGHNAVSFMCNTMVHFNNSVLVIKLDHDPLSVWEV